MLSVFALKDGGRISAFPCLMACLLLVEPRQEVKLVFAPRDGSSVVKQADFSIEFHSLSIDIEGHDYGDQGLTPLGLQTSAKFTDTYVKLAEGRPTELLRRFDELSGKWDEPRRRQDIGGFYALSGCTVRYLESQETQTLECTLKEGTAPGVRVGDLVEDMDLRGFLPAEAMKSGAKWTARGRPVMDALFGATEFGFAGISAEHEPEGSLVKFFLRPFRELGNKQIELTCTLVDDDSLAPELARIELRQQDKFHVDITDAVNEYLRVATNSEWRIDRFELDWDVDGKGRLLWNTALNRFESFDFEAEVDLDVLIELPNPQPGNGKAGWCIRLHLEGLAEWSTQVRVT